jgi:O6-methylguanine-DNA--protein-cysteine methyltransferase
MSADEAPRKSGLPYGAYAEIARRLGVSATAVRAVALGDATSARISEAIDQYRRDLAAELLAGAASVTA